MKSNDITLEANAGDVIGSMADKSDSVQQKNGGKKREPSKFKLPSKDSKTQLARGYFVEDMMDKIHDLIKGQLDSDFSYIAKPGKTPGEHQMTLENYLNNWWSQYTKGLNVGDKLINYAAGTFKTMQEHWNSEKVYKESLIRDLANATWLATQAESSEASNGTGSSTPPPKAQANDELDQASQQPLKVTPSKPVADASMAQAADAQNFDVDDGGYDPSVNYNIPAYKRQGKKIKGVKESKTQSALRAEKIPALKTR